MSEEITEKAYVSAAESVAAAHSDTVAKVKAGIAKSKSDALKKLSS
jgi:hypothetical protein